MIVTLGNSVVGRDIQLVYGLLVTVGNNCVRVKRFKDSLRKKVCARIILFLESGEIERCNC